MINKKNLMKKIIYRSTHRGTKEMDSLLGNFVKKNIDNLSDFELNDLNTLVEMDDEVLKDLYFGKNNKNKHYSNKFLSIFKKFKY
jgi:antitoxin CptB